MARRLLRERRGNVLSLNLSRVHRTILKWLYIEDTSIIDVILAAHVANLFHADPLWLLIIGSPSMGKTELLRGFCEHSNAYFLSTLTKSTLVSGFGGKASKEDCSLLPHLNDRTLIVKDLTTILTLRHEDRQEILSQLREIYDGKFDKGFGTGKRFSWEGKMGLIAACTTVYDTHSSVNLLGERFLLYRTYNQDDKEVGRRAKEVIGREEEMREEIREAVHTFIDQFQGVNASSIRRTKAVDEKIIELARFCARARCAVSRDYRNQIVENVPQPEGPARLVKQLMQLGAGLVLVRGMDVIDDSIYETLKKVGRDLIATKRLHILYYLWHKEFVEGYDKRLKTNEIAVGIDMPTNTVKLACEDLMIIKLLNRYQDLDVGENAPYQWSLSELACELISDSQIFENLPHREPWMEIE
jgi:hypothetical protein